MSNGAAPAPGSIPVRIVQAFAQLKEPGDCLWRHNDRGKPCRLLFKCPCGCGDVAAVTVKPAEPNGWQWNGSLERPTVTPSIFINPRENHWHGYLTDGYFKSV